jgi:hypothetical protein
MERKQTSKKDEGEINTKTMMMPTGPRTTTKTLNNQIHPRRTVRLVD